MKLIHRVSYYLGGFAIGVVILFFFLGGKKTSCDYGPNARVLKNIRSKNRVFSEMALKEFQANALDTAVVKVLLQNGEVLFSESETNKDSCNVYVVEGKHMEKKVKVSIKNCSKTATVISVDKNN